MLNVKEENKAGEGNRKFGEGLGLLAGWPRMFSLRTKFWLGTWREWRSKSCCSQGKNILDRRNSMCKGPKVGIGLGECRGGCFTFSLRWEDARGFLAEVWQGLTWFHRISLATVLLTYIFIPLHSFSSAFTHNSSFSWWRHWSSKKLKQLSWNLIGNE